MWSRRRFLSSLAIGSAGLGLSACGFRPLYEGGEIGGVAADLSAIVIDDPRTRLEQTVRNELVFLFTGGSAPAAQRYRMRLDVSESVSNLVIEQVTGRPTASSLRVRARVTLLEAGVGRRIFRETFEASASFEQSTQRFANERAQLDAGRRAAREVAGRIRTRTAIAIRADQAQ
ncbi:MAG: LPS assembly lipoprotein LptE [Pseudomonadota bacterium]